MTTRILYVEDEPDIREIAVMALELDPGFEVRGAASGEEGLRMLRAGAWIPDVVLLDLMMPGMDGQAVLRAMRLLPGYAATPVLFVTARTQAVDIERLLAQGAQGVITKPFDPMTLATTVRGLIR